MAEKTEAQKRAQRAYMEKFIRVEIRMTPEDRKTALAHAESRGESMSAFINRAIAETAEWDDVYLDIANVLCEMMVETLEPLKHSTLDNAAESRAKSRAHKLFYAIRRSYTKAAHHLCTKSGEGCEGLENMIERLEACMEEFDKLVMGKDCYVNS